MIGVELERAGYSGVQIGVVVGALLAGSAAVSLLLARHGERIGRRRAYRLLLVAMGIAGLVFALTTWLPALILAGLTGAVSTESNDNGPMTALEQAMLPSVAGTRTPAGLFGVYNAVAVGAGAVGALAAALPGGRWLLLSYPVAALVASVAASRISAAVEAIPRDPAEQLPPLHRSKSIVHRLAGLFALDSLGGGFVVQTYLAFWLTRRFDADPQLLGVVFFVTGLLAAASFYAAVRLAARIGLLRTMVFTHLPSNLLLAAVPFSPNLEVAIGLLCARFALSQMDVPTRQAYVVGVVDPSERVAAAALTGTARAVVRPLAPLVAMPLLGGALAAPFVIAGALKCIYDLGLYGLFRKVDPA